MENVVGKRISPICDRYTAGDRSIDVLTIRDKTWITVRGELRPFLSRHGAIQAVEMELGL